MSEATKEKAKLSIINEANDERSDAFDAVTDTKAKKSKGVPGEDDERNSLHSEEDEYDEIDMGEIDEIKAPKMDVIEEAPEELQLTDPVERAPSPISKKKKAKAEEQKATIHDSFDTFIVNDYFGEEDKCFESSIDMTGIFAFKNNDNEKNLNETNDVNGTMDAIVANLESASKLTKASKPIKVNDINQVMDNIDYVVSKNSSKSRSSAKEDVNIGPKKGTKAWESWWKKKKAVNGDLLNAAQIGDFEKVKSLLDKDIQKEFVANIKFQGLDNFTALHFAAQGGHYEICEFLIENGCDVEARSNMGRTPLHLAAISGLSNILMLLLTNGADINSQDEDMYSALHHASEGGNTECVKLLVERGADVTLKNNIGSSPNDISQNIDVRSLIEQYSDKEEIITDSLARRSEMGGVILRNDRKNYVERLMGRFQKVDKYLKETKNGSEEALIESIEKQQKQREEDRKRQRGMRQVKTEVENKKKKKEGRFERNKDKFLQIVQLEMKMKEELRGFGIEQDEAGPALFNPIGRLGRGSFGEVYLVEKLPEGDQYAMKILHKRRIMGQNLVRYARTERDVLSYFAHPFIVSIKYAFQTPEKLYMILEYCPGGDLGSVLKREKKLTEERAKLYLSEIILAIETLHQKDIIFRDLKPDNVVLDAEGHAMLTDFGLSKEGVTNNSSAKSFCGSVAYLAPEVLRRQGHGKSVDWYLVGVLLYEMLCGIPPYFSSNKDQMFKNIKSGPLRMPERFSKETKDFIVKLLNKNPSKRLGAGKGDAEELKQHPFFEGVNWKDVLERKQKMPKPVIREIKKSTVNLTDIVYGEYAGVGRVASSKEVEYHKALQKRGQTVKDTADADDLDRNKIPGWSFIGSPSN